MNVFYLSILSLSLVEVNQVGSDQVLIPGSKQLMAKRGLVIHRSDEGQKSDPFDYIRKVSFDGVDFG